MAELICDNNYTRVCNVLDGRQYSAVCERRAAVCRTLSEVPSTDHPSSPHSGGVQGHAVNKGLEGAVCVCVCVHT